jgi:hypothetical protein
MFRYARPALTLCRIVLLREETNMKRFQLLSGILLGTLLVTVAWAAGVDGKWKAEYEMQGQTRQTTFTFQVNGEKLTGTVAGRSGEVQIQDGKITGNEISFFAIRNIGGNEMKFNYKGTVDGDQIKLKVSVGDGERTFEMIAKRAN